MSNEEIKKTINGEYSIGRNYDLDYLPMEDCVHGGFYKIRARNFSCGVYDEKQKAFIGIRYKFGDVFLFPEYHWDTGEPHGTCKPKKFIKMCPLEEIDCGTWKDKVWTENKELFDWIKENKGE